MAAPRKHPQKDAAEVIERLAAAGHSIVGIARQLGVSKETFKRWCEDYESLQEAFEVGRETERQALHALIVQSAVLNKPANVNAFFILKARHGYRENEPNQLNVGVSVAPAHVLVLRDHGTNDQWAAKAEEQQRQLVAHAASPVPIHKLPAPRKEIEEATIVPQRDAVPVPVAPSWLPAHIQAPPAPTLRVILVDDAPGRIPSEPVEWKANA